MLQLWLIVTPVLCFLSFCLGCLVLEFWHGSQCQNCPIKKTIKKEALRDEHEDLDSAGGWPYPEPNTAMFRKNK